MNKPRHEWTSFTQYMYVLSPEEWYRQTRSLPLTARVQRLLQDRIEITISCLNQYCYLSTIGCYYTTMFGFAIYISHCSLTRFAGSTCSGALPYNVHVHFSTVQYSTVQYSTVYYSTVQYSIAQYSKVEYSTIQ